jgi:hypothetical protein
MEQNNKTFPGITPPLLLAESSKQNNFSSYSFDLSQTHFKHSTDLLRVQPTFAECEETVSAIGIL